MIHAIRSTLTRLTEKPLGALSLNSPNTSLAHA
jgi:hypothetical protein